MTGSMRLSRVLLWVAFGVLAAFGLLGSLFIIGVTMSDPGGVTGVLLVMLWLVPMAVASTVCLVWPRVGRWVGLGCVALVAALWLWYALDQEWWRSLMDDRGPVIGIATFSLGLPLACLGLHLPRLAGALLLVAGAIPLLALFGQTATSATTAGIPFLITGALFLLSGLLGHDARAPASAPDPHVPVG
jgi:hypothetical protein